jgi:hypothetical protein
MIHFDEVFISTALQIKADNLFVENGVLTEAGIIESIAQTCAVRMGYINRLLQAGSSEKVKIKLGFIGAIKNLVIERSPEVGDEITVTAEVVSEVFAITLVDATVKIGDEPVASCKMKISITDIDSQDAA